jgi:hypothetical protein
MAGNCIEIASAQRFTANMLEVKCLACQLTAGVASLALLLPASAVRCASLFTETDCHACLQPAYASVASCTPALAVHTRSHTKHSPNPAPAPTPAAANCCVASLTIAAWERAFRLLLLLLLLLSLLLPALPLLPLFCRCCTSWSSVSLKALALLTGDASWPLCRPATDLGLHIKCGDIHEGLPTAYGDEHAALLLVAPTPACGLDQPLPGADATPAKGDRLPIGTASCCKAPAAGAMCVWTSMEGAIGMGVLPQVVPTNAVAFNAALATGLRGTPADAAACRLCAVGLQLAAALLQQLPGLTSGEPDAALQVLWGSVALAVLPAGLAGIGSGNSRPAGSFLQA